MKIRVLDRILVALAGLLMVVGGVALAAELFFGKNVSGKVSQWLADGNNRVFIIIAGILIIVIGVYCVLLLFRHRGKSGKFIMQKTESGELAISLDALGSMVQKCLDQHQELSAQAVELENEKGSLVVTIRGTVAGGISIPLTIDTLQQQVKQYVTACSGVEVKDIRVEVVSSGPDAKDAPFAIEAPAAIGLLKGTDETLSELPGTESGENADNTATEQAEKAIPEASAAESVQAEDELSAAAAAAALVMDHAPAEEDDRPMHQRLFSTVEEPCVMPMPPKDLEETKPSEESKSEGTKPDVAKTEEEVKTEDTKPAMVKKEIVNAEDMKPEPKTPEAAKTEDVKPAEEKPEEVKTEEIKPENEKAETGEGEKTEKGKGFFSSKKKAKQKNIAKEVPAATKAEGVND